MKVIHNESGMTLTELLFATLLLSFVIIALTTLMMGAITATSLAKTQTKATALANKLIEEVRGKAYAEVGIVGSTDPNVPSGNLPADPQSITEGNTTYEYWYEVEWFDDSADGTGVSDADNNENDYKKVTIRVSWSDSSGSKIKVVTNIREKNASTAAPTVDFVSPPTPDTLTAVSGTAVSIRGTASDTDGTIVYLRFYFEGHTPAGANFTENSDSVTETYIWNTTETYTDEYGVEQISYPDGAREVKVQAWDNAGATSYREVYLLVDNEAPAFAESDPLSGEPLDYSTVTLTWEAATDGTDRVEEYFVYSSSDGSSWTKTSVGASGLIYNPVTSIFTYQHDGLTAWTSYQFYIEARSPLNIEDENEGYAVTSNIDTDKTTLIQLTGNWTKVGNDYDNNLSWTGIPADVTCTDFDIYRNGSLYANITSNYYTDLNVIKNDTYTYEIKAKNGSQIINTSNELSLTPGS